VRKVVYFSKQVVSSTQIHKLLVMADSSLPVSQVCSRFHRAIELIGSRWTGAILQTLLQGRTRYAAIKSAIPDITDRMLSERLRSLEAEALLVRSVIPDTPVRVEYELTLKGRELQNALREIGSWAERWIPLESDTNDDSTGESSASRPRPMRHARKTGTV
jgi:DNA-binding HxlR family transcriptional regulator